MLNWTFYWTKQILLYLKIVKANKQRNMLTNAQLHSLKRNKYSKKCTWLKI